MKIDSVLERSAEGTLIASLVTLALQMNTAEAALSVSVISGVAAVIYKGGQWTRQVTEGQREMVRAIRRVDRRVGRLEKHAEIDPVDDEQDLEVEPT